MGTSAWPGQQPFDNDAAALSDVGEDALLAALAGIAAAAMPPMSPPADDAAIWTPTPGLDSAISVDALVEGVDFRRSWTSPRRLGGRAFRVAASDLAATGASAQRCLVTLCARPSDTIEDVLEIQRGLCAAAAAAGCAVVGGDVSASDGPLTISICVVGEQASGAAMRRDAGRPGDLLVVTGSLGEAAAGLRLLLEERAPQGAEEHGWIDAQLDGRARLAEGQRLLDLGIACAGDLSDGLLVDAERTGRASACAAELWAGAVPVSPALRTGFGAGWPALALAGGEDFELLFAVAPHALEAVRSGWSAELAPLTVVGRLALGEGVRLLDGEGGAEMAQPAPTSRHFR